MPFFPTEALAQGAQAAPAGDPLSQLLPTLLPMIAIFGVFYFLMIRPQQKRQREHVEMLKKIKKGDKVALLFELGSCKENPGFKVRNVDLN